LVISRFIAGLPHGAYFGVAALVAATLAGPQKRAQAVSRVMLGLTIATVIGVPFATWLGQHFGWRSGFVFASAIGILTIIAIWFAMPKCLPLMVPRCALNSPVLKNRKCG